VTLLRVMVNNIFVLYYPKKRKGCDNKVDVKMMNMIFYCRKEKVVIIRLM
jgi:hypothetical protein